MIATMRRVTDQDSMPLPSPEPRAVRPLVAGDAGAPALALFAVHRDHRRRWARVPYRLEAARLPAGPPAPAEVDADNIAGRRTQPDHLVAGQLRPDALAVRQ